MNAPTKAPMNASRRQFLFTSAAITGGFALGFTLPTNKAWAAAAADAPTRVNIWVEIAEDDTVTIKYARSEMGQGSMTSAPQLVADELDANWEQVRIAYVDVNEHYRMEKAWGSMATVGSQTIRNSQSYLRQAGATARTMLVSAAAQHFATVEAMGEFVVVLAAAEAPLPADEDLITEALVHEFSAGVSTRDAVDAVVKKTNAPKRVVYALALLLNNKEVTNDK